MPSAPPRAGQVAEQQPATARDHATGRHPADPAPDNGDRPARGQRVAPPHIQPAPSARSRAKRLLDLTLVMLALPLVLPLGLLIATLVACTSRGRILFLQERVGLGGMPFRMIKFRTMRTDAEQQLRANPELWESYVRNDFKLPAGADTRVTPIGRFLRRSSLDELPQLINVVLGQMSLVGPRPVVPDELDKYGDERHVYLSVRPGITGTWQVNGRSGIGYPARVDLDRQYAESWTFWLDVHILLRTPVAVLTSRGAH